MGLLLWFDFPAESDLTEFLGHFYAGLRHMVPSVSTRYTVDQVAAQSGVRRPYVPWTALWAFGRTAAHTRDDYLLLHASREPHYTFRLALKLFLARPEHQDMSFYDMNTMQRVTRPEEDEIPGFFGLCRSEMSSFRAAVLLPHNPAPTRLLDLYAQMVPIFFPGSPTVHRYIWENGAFGGLGSPPIMRESAPADLLATVARSGQGTHEEGEHPPFSPLQYLRVEPVDFPFEHLEDKRYWYQYTEFALLPGLQAFTSIADLLLRLRRLESDAPHIREIMTQHLAVRRGSGLGWWRAALAIQMAPPVDE
eukprot:TRINITY_DN74256_c0_g1_i1.p1 TRINITY_DN74256_c0_g1~~TRINITY_DN74256_c0_g1_i1.p1  ORF type:complete len:307 (-),score=23.48 TRINITY_DN74256_c0_g1_i1:421-1341(-)